MVDALHELVHCFEGLGQIFTVGRLKLPDSSLCRQLSDSLRPTLLEPLTDLLLVHTLLIRRFLSYLIGRFDQLPEAILMSVNENPLLELALKLNLKIFAQLSHPAPKIIHVLLLRPMSQ